MLSSLLAVTAATWCALQPTVVETRFTTADLVIASVVLDAPRPEDDATGLIQSAVDEVAAAGGGTVFLKAGWYRLAERLLVKEGVTLRGDWDPAAKGRAKEATILMPTADRGNEDGPAAIQIERGTGLRELVIWYPDQRPDDMAPYPWAIRTAEPNVGNNTTVLNVTLVNPWQGIRIGPEWNELHTIRNVQMTPLKCGLFLDGTTDIGRLMDVDLSPSVWESSKLPGWPNNTAKAQAVRALMLKQAIGLDMGRSDWEYIHRLRVDSLHLGMRCRAGERGTANAVMLDSRLTSCGTGLRLEQLNGIGLSATNCSIAGVEATESFTTVAQFHQSSLGDVHLRGSGTLTLQGCSAGTIRADQGTVDSLQTTFGSTSPHVVLSEHVGRARVFGQGFTQLLSVENESPGDVMFNEDRRRFRYRSYRSVPSPDRDPAVRTLILAADHGVRAEAADNTAALQQALDAAAGGGTVYLPAGLYRFAGSVRVPTGVELRGSFDVPHHTVSGGSVLMPTGGQGNENGRPFIELSESAGARGICVWYPEQNLAAPVAYPWTIRGLGPNCWLTDVNLGNAWQGVDFWTYPSDGHVVKYLSGCCLRRGLFVSKSETTGWIENLQFNPHYAARLHPSLPHPRYEGDIFGKLIEGLRDRLEGIVIGRCEDEKLLGTFLYAAADGLAFRDDDGGATALVLQHGSDTVGRPLVLEAADEVLGVHMQLVPLSHKAVAAFVTGPEFRGHARFINSQVWAGNRTALLQGPGRVELEQLNTLTGPVEVENGELVLTNALFSRLQPNPVRVGAKARATVRGCLMDGPFEVAAEPGAQVTLSINSASIPPKQGAADGEHFRLATGFEQGQPQPVVDKVATRGGGLKSVSNPACRVVDGVGRDGGRALKLVGKADDPAYSYVYFRIFNGPVKLAEDSRLSYWILPLNERAQASFVDLLFADGKVMRDAGAGTVEGTSSRAVGGLAKVGEWRQITIPLGKFAGNDVVSVMFAYDSRSGGGPFEALIDDFAIESELAGKPWPIEVIRDGRLLTLRPAAGARVRYTLDGSNPTLTSPVADGPLQRPTGELVELRYRAETEGWLSPVIYAMIWQP